jgi:hypothetical protein
VLKGDEHAVAILPQGVKLEGLAEAGDVLVLRVRDASAATELRKKLVQSGSQMAAVAGLLQVRGWGCCWADCEMLSLLGTQRIRGPEDGTGL